MATSAGTLLLATLVTPAPSAPWVSAPAEPLVVPTPVTTLPVATLLTVASVSARAVGTSSITWMVRLASAVWLIESTTCTGKTMSAPLGVVSVTELSVSVKVKPIAPGAMLVTVRKPMSSWKT